MRFTCSGISSSSPSGLGGGVVKRLLGPASDIGDRCSREGKYMGSVCKGRL